MEPFAGSAAVLRHKRPAERSIALDLDPGAIATLAGVGPRPVPLDPPVPPGSLLLVTDALDWLESYPWDGSEFVYADPPYLPSTCTSYCKYRHNLTAADHERLLAILSGLPCRVMLSGYHSNLYARRLRRWWTDHYTVVVRSSETRQEWLWMNYEKPADLHDYRYLGDDYRQRENLVRMRRPT